ncbi:hypothetical protein ANN_04094 [Periplaneta americana]|uniref:Uncharacterized protein n=1 Tax=Periplaneta americana TaxID=6978 RepID=A0ABQ8T9F3_PERAM|nr:hypothetical protein ANN_04094 [Periplaneta americana]
MWLADEPREFNLPSFPQRRITYVPEKLPGKYGVHSEEYLPIRTKLLSSSLLSNNLKVRIYKTIILPVVLYGCETWTLTLREEQRLRVFENKVLRKIFEAKRDEVTGEWIKLHNAELHALYSSPDIIRNIKSRRLRWTGHVTRMGESRNACRVLAGRPEGKRPLGRPRRRWEDNIKMDLRENGELLRNNRHHRARIAIANLLRNRGWEVHEEIHCMSEDDSHRKVYIIAINKRTQKAMVLDLTICFERDTNQALQINDDKRAKYVPCLPYLSEKYGISLYNWDVTGLLFGAKDCLPKFTFEFLQHQLVLARPLTCPYLPRLHERLIDVASAEKHRPLSSSENIQSAPQARSTPSCDTARTDSRPVAEGNIDIKLLIDLDLILLSVMHRILANPLSEYVHFEEYWVSCGTIFSVVRSLYGVGYPAAHQRFRRMSFSISPVSEPVQLRTVPPKYNSRLQSANHSRQSYRPHTAAKNDAETDQEEEKELIPALAEKKLPTEGCTGRNGERKKSSVQKKVLDDRRY